MLNQPEILERASDRDIFMAAMRLTAARLEAVGKTVGLKPDVVKKLHYPQCYLSTSHESLLEKTS